MVSRVKGEDGGHPPPWIGVKGEDEGHPPPVYQCGQASKVYDYELSLFVAHVDKRPMRGCRR